MIVTFRERKLVWHGSNPWGERDANNCDSWTSEDTMAFGMASYLGDMTVNSDLKI